MRNPTEYEATLQWYREFLKQHETSTLRRYQEYTGYLKDWFGDGRCDGFSNFQERRSNHTLPMSMNVYFC